MQMEQFNGILLHLELAGPDPDRGSAEHQGPAGGRVHHLPLPAGKGEDFSLDDALDNSNSMQSMQKTTLAGLWVAKW